MTEEGLKIELRKYLTEKEFLNPISKKINQLLILDNISKLPYNVIKDIDSVVPLPWWWISRYQKLSEDFIREFQDRVDWNDISSNQKLSEGFIIEFQDKVDWFLISGSQKLSEEFILKNIDRIDFRMILKNRQIKKPFKDKTLQCYYELNYMNKKT
jgi:hypothetical protein